MREVGPKTGRFLTVGASNGVFTYDIVSRVPVELQARGLPEDSSRLPQLIELLRSSKSASGFVVVPTGSVSGAGGAHFRSDVSIMNNRATAQKAELIWIPADFAAPRAFEVTLPPSETATVPGFVERLGVNGLGALLVLGVDANADIEANAARTSAS